MTNSTFTPGAPLDVSDRARKLDSIAWAVFFIWVGVAMLAQLAWGWFFLGVGALVLAVQIVRWQMDMKVEAFWVVCGIVFLADGLCNLFDLPWPLAPILIILLGVVLLSRAVVGVKR